MNRQKRIYQNKPTETDVGRELKQCRCGLWFDLPACHAQRHRSCSASCAAHWRKVDRQSRAKRCLVCEAGFIPRRSQLANGGGKYCSNKCAVRVGYAALTTPAAIAARAASRRDGEQIGRTVRAVGPEHPRWKGGSKASVKRRIASGALAEQVREYRRRNPEKLREWTQSRKRRKFGRLPRGTIAMKMRVQNGACAACGADITSGYHADHIMPLALGGPHTPENIQLLCAPCNLRKSAKHPNRFRQEIAEELIKVAVK